MKTEFTINPSTGEMVVRRVEEALLTCLQRYLGTGQDADCGESPLSVKVAATRGSVRIAGIVHGSMVDGPGLRSVVFFQGCAHRCKGCHSPHTHDPSGGIGMTVSELVTELMRKDIPRDGVTFSGGDPLVQPEACAEIASRLKDNGVHVIVYTGFTFEQLLHLGNPAVRKTLALADVLVDGSFIAPLGDESLAYRGSSNQRVIDLAKTRQTGSLCLLDWDDELHSLRTIEEKSAMETTSDKEMPRTKLDLVYAIRDLIGSTKRGVLEAYEFEQMRKPSLIALYDALKQIN